MWFGWNKYGWDPRRSGFGPMYGPCRGGGFYGEPYEYPYEYAYRYGSPYYNTQYSEPYAPQWEGSYDPKKMELMALKEELEFMSYRVNIILNRLDELEKEMK